MITRIILIAALSFSCLAVEFSPRAVNTMAELRALRPLDSKPSVEVLGYYTPGDGGGGTYVLTNTVAGTNAYGGRVLALGGAKSWELNDQFPKAEQFGAYGTGDVDDTTALNAALAWAAGRKMSLTASKWYRLDGQLQCVDNTSIEFAGTGRLTRNGVHVAVRNHPYSYPGDTPQAPDVIVVSTNLVFKNGTIDNFDQTTSSTFPIIQMYGAAQVKFLNMTVGGQTNGLNANWLCSFWADDVTVSNCRFQNIPGIYNDAFHVLGGRRYNIANSTFIGGDDAIALLHIWDLGMSDIEIVNCHLVSYSAHCIRLGRWNSVTPSSQTNWIKNITIKNCTGEFGHRNGGIYLQDFAVSGTNYTRLVDNILIEGVMLRANDSFPTFGTTNSYNFNVTGCSNVVFDNVTIEGSINKAQVNWNSNFRGRNLKLRNSSGQVLSFNGTGRVELEGPDLSSDRATQNVYFLDTWSVLIRGGEIQNPASTYNIETGAGVNDITVVGTKLHSGNKGIRLFVSPNEFTALGNVFLANNGIQFSIGGAPAYTKVVGNINQTDYITGIVDHHTPDYVPLWKVYRDDWSTTTNLLEFNLSANLPTWYTTNASWFRWQSTRGQYGWTDNTDNTEKNWIYGVGNYDSDRNGVVALYGRSTGTANIAYIGGGATTGDHMTELRFHAAVGVEQNSSILMGQVNTNGLRIQQGVAAPPTKILQVLSTTSGIVPPVMTTAQGDTLVGASPSQAEMWFDSTVARPRQYNGTRAYYGVQALFGSVIHDLGSIAAGGAEDVSGITITGARTGNLVLVTCPGGFDSALIYKGWVTGDDTVTMRVVNAGSSSYNHGSTTFRIIVIPQ